MGEGQGEHLLEQNKSILVDYFVLKFDYNLKQYVTMGKEGGAKTDRSVFLDLLTET